MPSDEQWKQEWQEGLAVRCDGVLAQFSALQPLYTPPGLIKVP